MLLKYIADAEERGGVLLTESTLKGMERSCSAGISDDDMEDESDGDDDVEEVDEESGDDDDSDNEKQVLMRLCLFHSFLQ